jgi:hypothetical protein
MEEKDVTCRAPPDPAIWLLTGKWWYNIVFKEDSTTSHTVNTADSVRKINDISICRALKGADLFNIRLILATLEAFGCYGTI